MAKQFEFNSTRPSSGLHLNQGSSTFLRLGAPTIDKGTQQGTPCHAQPAQSRSLLQMMASFLLLFYKSHIYGKILQPELWIAAAHPELLSAS